MHTCISTPAGALFLHFSRFAGFTRQAAKGLSLVRRPTGLRCVFLFILILGSKWSPGMMYFRVFVDIGEQKGARDFHEFPDPRNEELFFFSKPRILRKITGQFWFWKLGTVDYRSKWLGGGFKYFLYPPLFGKMIQIDEYFSNGLKLPTRCVWWVFFLS